MPDLSNKTPSPTALEQKWQNQAKTPPEPPKISKGAGCLTVIILCLVIGWLAYMAGCGPEGVDRVGPNGATAYPTIPEMYGSSIRLEPGTKVQPEEKVSDNSWRYEIEEGKYAGIYAVISDDEVEFK